MSTPTARDLRRKLAKLQRLIAINQGRASPRILKGPRRKLYVLGNCLRCYFEGRFDDSATAWKWLSRRFLMAFPSHTGRQVYMRVEQKNEFGFTDFATIKGGITWRGSVPRGKILRRCRNSNEFF